MDIALVLDKLVPAAKYGGSLTDNTKDSYDKLRWKDTRKKPSWDTIVKEWAILSAELEKEEKIQKRIEGIKQTQENTIRTQAINELTAESML